MLRNNLKIKQFVKTWFHRFNMVSPFYKKREKVKNLVASLLPNLTIIDVGASYYPHPQFEVFRRSRNTLWVAVEPNEENLFYLKGWYWPSSVMPVTKGLSRSGGKQILHITNVDSGSSLNPPEVTKNNEHRILDMGYFFPVREVEIDTITLQDVLQKIDTNHAPILIKLDTQGSEYSILQGLHEDVMDKSVVGVELECTLLAEPLMKGSTAFSEIMQYFNSKGFELVHIKPIQLSAPVVNSYLRSSHVLNECDAVFLLKNSEAKSRSLEIQLALLGAYISYSLFGEALNLASHILVSEALNEMQRTTLKEIISKLER